MPRHHQGQCEHRHRASDGEPAATRNVLRRALLLLPLLELQLVRRDAIGERRQVLLERPCLRQGCAQRGLALRLAERHERLLRSVLPRRPLPRPFPLSARAHQPPRVVLQPPAHLVAARAHEAAHAYEDPPTHHVNTRLQLRSLGALCRRLPRLRRSLDVDEIGGRLEPHRAAPDLATGRRGVDRRRGGLVQKRPEPALGRGRVRRGLRGPAAQPLAELDVVSRREARRQVLHQWELLEERALGAEDDGEKGLQPGIGVAHELLLVVAQAGLELMRCGGKVLSKRCRHVKHRQLDGGGPPVLERKGKRREVRRVELSADEVKQARQLRDAGAEKALALILLAQQPLVVVVAALGDVVADDGLAAHALKPLVGEHLREHRLEQLPHRHVTHLGAALRLHRVRDDNVERPQQPLQQPVLEGVEHVEEERVIRFIRARRPSPAALEGA
mmetsp:Transcript_14331/g.35531  ORF Transcript_14331/g.35531 Transcript_14331/m.35531 type:complete len:445 (-) Transcript_14331:613-1947(-)